MFERTKLRGITHRSLQEFGNALAGRSEIEQRAGMMQGAMVSVALGHACYPTASYGDERDDLLDAVKQSDFTPSDPKRSCELVELWLDRHEVSMAAAFEEIWSTDYMTFLNSVFNKDRTG